MQIIHAGPGTAVATLAEAIALLPPDDGSQAEIRLSPGVYREKITLSRPHTTLRGESAGNTRIVWHDGAKEILADGMKRGTFRTATLMVDAPHVTLHGLTIENAAAPREEAGQAIALYADGDGLLVEDCILLGHQDTLFTAPMPPKEIEPNGFIGPKQFAPRTPQRQAYRRCLICGDVDFIFGGAAVWFEDCEIHSVDGRRDRSHPCEGYVTAASTPEGQRFGYIFHHCRFTAKSVAAASVYLGRPWRDWAKTLLIDCELGAHIHPDGFHDWNKPQAHATMDYAQYGSVGPGAAGPRATFCRTMQREAAEQLTYAYFMAHALEQTLV